MPDYDHFATLTGFVCFVHVLKMLPISVWLVIIPVLLAVLSRVKWCSPPTDWRVSHLRNLAAPKDALMTFILTSEIGWLMKKCRWTLLYHATKDITICFTTEKGSDQKAHTKNCTETKDSKSKGETKSETETKSKYWRRSRHRGSHVDEGAGLGTYGGWI